MTDLNKLAVSLTKHGAYKVANLLERDHANEVIPSVWGKFAGINIDSAQARKTLSASQDDKLPEVWGLAKKAGRQSINSLVLLAIIYSHHTLIEAMKGGIRSYGVGTIKRKDIDNGKAFTNFKNDFEELNFTTSASEANFTFDIRPILRDNELGRLAVLLFRAKLADARWTGENNPVDECLRVEFHRALGMSEAQFRQWTAGKRTNLDELPDTIDPDKAEQRAFTFKAGHRKRKSGEVIKQGHGKAERSGLIHNELQNILYDYLVSKFGKQNVQSENTSGPTQTSIDLD